MLPDASNFDRFGTKTYTGPASFSTYLDLTRLRASFIPLLAPVGICTSTLASITYQIPFSVIATIVPDLSAVEDLLHPAKGLHYLMYVQEVTVNTGNAFRVRHHSIPASELIGVSNTQPRTMTEWLNVWEGGKVSVDLSRYPNTCLRCGAAAYIGANLIDCSANCK